MSERRTPPGRPPPRRSRWDRARDARRRNPLGDWAFRAALGAGALPFIGLLAGSIVFGGGYGSILGGMYGGIAAGVLGFLATLLGLAGLSEATGGRRNTQSAWWGIALGLTFAALGAFFALGGFFSGI